MSPRSVMWRRIGRVVVGVSSEAFHDGSSLILLIGWPRSDPGRDKVGFRVEPVELK